MGGRRRNRFLHHTDDRGGMALKDFLGRKVKTNTGCGKITINPYIPVSIFPTLALRGDKSLFQKILVNYRIRSLYDRFLLGINFALSIDVVKVNLDGFDRIRRKFLFHTRHMTTVLDSCTGYGRRGPKAEDSGIEAPGVTKEQLCSIQYLRRNQRPSLLTSTLRGIRGTKKTPCTLPKRYKAGR
jgi:hypothetical protein